MDKIKNFIPSLVRQITRHRTLSDPSVILLAAIALGCVVRLPAVIGRSFPINDGGFWLVASKTIIDNNFAWPSHVLFNGELIPFFYPPLAAYLVALVSACSSASIEQILLYFPTALSICSVGLFAIFARRILSDRQAASFASLVFPLLLNSHTWFIFGGGISRSLGLCFELLAFIVFTSEKEVSRKGVISTALCMALAMLSHPNAAIHATIGISLIAYQRGKLGELLKAGVLSGLLISPWLLTVFSKLGLEPFFFAFQEGHQGVSHFLSFLAQPSLKSGSPIFDTLALLALVLVFSLKLKDRFAAIAFITLFFIDRRGLLNNNGCIVVGLLIGQSLSSLNRLLGLSGERVAPVQSLLRKGIVSVLFVHLLIANFAVSIHSTYFSSPAQQDIVSLRSLVERGSLNSGTYVPFLDWNQLGDGFSEWISVLSGAHYPFLVQMSEWTTRRVRSIELQSQIRRCCANPTVDCFMNIAGQLDNSFTVVAHNTSCSGIPLLLKEIPNCAEEDREGDLILHHCRF